MGLIRTETLQLNQGGLQRYNHMTIVSRWLGSNLKMRKKGRLGCFFQNNRIRDMTMEWKYN